MAAQPPQVVKATLTALPGGTPLPVQFNPTSLVYSVENSVAQQSGAPKKAQYVAQFSAKLTMDLQFDTTDTGANVVSITGWVARFMQASGNASAAAANNAPQSSDGGSQGPPPKAPPVLLFQWGAFQFQGIMDSFKETIDFFSADGIPLRSLVSIGLSRQDKIFDVNFFDALAATDVGSKVPGSSSQSVLALATLGGDPRASRQLGADNGLESLRFTGGQSMQVGGGVQLNPPVAFVANPSASGGNGMSLGASAAAGAGASAGVSLGGSSGISAGATGGPSSGTQIGGLGPVFGAAASAGVMATSGAFAGLQTGRTPTSTTANLNPLQMLPATVGSDVASFSGASFSLGGAAKSIGSSGLSSDVGSNFSFADRLTFNSDD